MPLDPEIRLEGDGRVRRLILNRPARHNAQTPRLWAQLAAAGHALAADTDVRCVVISGAGKSFSSGIDLAEIDREGVHWCGGRSRWGWPCAPAQ